MGLCGPASADCGCRVADATFVWDVTVCHPIISSVRELRAGMADGITRARTRRRPVRARAGGAVLSVRRCVPHTGPPVHHERVRTASLDGLRVCGDPYYQDRQSEAVVMGRAAGRDWTRE